MSTFDNAIDSALRIMHEQTQEPRFSNLIAQAPCAQTGNMLTITLDKDKPLREAVSDMLAVDMLAHIIEINANPNVDYDACVILDGSRVASGILDDVAKKLNPAIGRMIIRRNLDS